MTRKIVVLSAVMALLSLAGCYNGGNHERETATSPSFDEVLTQRPEQLLSDTEGPCHGLRHAHHGYA